MSLRYSDVTPRHVYTNRRKFISAGAATIASFGASFALPSFGAAAPLVAQKIGPLHNLFNDKLPPKPTILGYNNFYEFGTNKDDPAKNAHKWTPAADWSIRIEGEVKAPKVVSLSQIVKGPLEERIYRMRCVEGWSMIIPWIGIPLSTLLKEVELTGKAKFVAFESYYDPKIMNTSRNAGINFPYVEGLRLDEAMHPLTLLAVGVYGDTLPVQSGAPVRLVVPWKYGFKGIKSITRIRLVEKQPPTSWNLSWSRAYGFYSNVNPKVPHPRYDQDYEDRLDGSGFLGQGKRIRTEMFNGYGAQVASLYSGMDLVRNY